MITLNWIDIKDKSTVKLQLAGKHIYSAYKNEERVTLASIRGMVLLNINQEVVKLPYWLVYESMNNDIMISPLYENMLPTILENSAMFDQPVDIRLVFQMIDL